MYFEMLKEKILGWKKYDGMKWSINEFIISLIQLFFKQTIVYYIMCW